MCAIDSKASSKSTVVLSYYRNIQGTHSMLTTTRETTIESSPVHGDMMHEITYPMRRKSPTFY